jgi:hypothetical protein
MVFAERSATIEKNRKWGAMERAAGVLTVDFGAVNELVESFGHGGPFSVGRKWGGPGSNRDLNGGKWTLCFERLLRTIFLLHLAVISLEGGRIWKHCQQELLYWRVD